MFSENVQKYLSEVEEIVKTGGNIWNHPKAQTLGQLYLDALSDGTIAMHDLLGEVWSLYRRYGLRIDGTTRQVVPL